MFRICKQNKGIKGFASYLLHWQLKVETEFMAAICEHFSYIWIICVQSKTINDYVLHVTHNTLESVLDALRVF